MVSHIEGNEGIVLRKYISITNKKKWKFRKKYSKQYNLIANKVYSIDPNLGRKLLDIIDFFVEQNSLEGIEVTEENYMDYVHSVLDYLAKKNPELEEFVDKSKVMDIEDKIKQAEEILERRMRYR